LFQFEVNQLVNQQIDPALLVLGHYHCIPTGLVYAASALSSVLTLKAFGI